MGKKIFQDPVQQIANYEIVKSICFLDLFVEM